MSDSKEKVTGKKRVKKKMSKAQMQLAILKKKQCDAKALLIVERLLEPSVNSEWLLQNLRHINKSHMEDVIEERAIIKLCGYVLCQNPLTVTITQKYHISTRNNKVYDVTKRKNFCSSRCYGASSYLLEQMLTSPLWLRDNEEIPTFQLLEARNEAERSLPGEEVLVQELNVASDKPIEKVENSNFIQAGTNAIPDNMQVSAIGVHEACDKEIIQKNNAQTKNTFANINLSTTQESVEASLDIISTNENLQNTEIEKVDVLEQMASCEISLEERDDRDLEVTNKSYSSNKSFEDLKKSIVKDMNMCGDTNKNNDLDVEFLGQDNEICKKGVKTNLNSNKHKKNQHIGTEEKSTRFYTLVVHIEECVKEWITEDTLSLLAGHPNDRNRLLENVSQEDKYLQLCKKLNRIQLEEEKEDRVDLANTTLKPLPHLSVLREEGKKMELKVRAFYQGNVIIEQPVSSTEVDINAVQSSPVLPLIDAHAPKALRRRIFLDKLHKILPDLLLALTNKKQIHSTIEYNYSEYNVLVKALVNTFNLSANNITFKSAEWTLVGLIMIKMLSILDPQLKILLATKQASMYISMILLSYKLDSNYLDRLVIEVTNDTEIFNPIHKTIV